MITPVLKLQDAGLPVQLVFFESLPVWFDYLFGRGRHRTHASLRTLNASPRVLPRIPRNILGINTLVLLFALGPSLRKKGATVVHARGSQGAAVALPLKRLFKNLKVICDVRGLEAEEYEYGIRQSSGSLNHFQRLWRTKLEAISRYALIRADVVFSVSQALLPYLSQSMGPSISEKSEYMPCAVDVKRFSGSLPNRRAIRDKWGVVDRLVVVYSGSTAAWQIPELVIRVFKLLYALDPSAFFLGLTPDTCRLTDMLLEQNVQSSDFRVQRVDFKEVPDFLVSADLGLLIRQENIVNRFSCPTKFAEYLASGLHVIATPAVADVADCIKKFGVGTLVSDLTDERKMREELKASIASAKNVEERIRRSVEAADQHLNWSAYIPAMKKRYLELSSGSER